MKNKNYFSNFPRVSYKTHGVEFNTVDLSVRFKIIEDILKNNNAYYDYYWKDEDRVDIVADKYYGDSRYAWLVMLSAQAYDWVYDLPLDEKTFDVYLKEKYNVERSAELHSHIHHYEDAGGVYIDYETYETLPDSYKKAVSIYEFEEDNNENKRAIKLISKKYLQQITREFNSRLQDVKNTRRLFKTT